MIIIPNRLYQEPFVEVLHQNKHFSILRKQLKQTLINRQSYVSMHAVSIVIAGKQKIVGNDGQVIHIKQGEIGFIKKGLYTVTDILSGQNDFQSYHLYFENQLLNEVLSLYNSPLQNISVKSCFNIPSSPVILQYLDSLQYLAQVVKKRNYPVFRVKLMEFLTLAIAENEGFNILTQLKFFTQHQNPQNLVTFMSENFDKSLTVAGYAYLTGRSLSTFRREFKAKFGVSPHKWITQERMKKAMEMLEKGNLNVGEIAYHVGYENVSHFINSFKKYHGHTPKQTVTTENRLFFEPSKTEPE